MKKALLKSVFGHDAFQPGQKELIDALQGGRDLLGVMATGSGKSLCYQFPAVEHGKRCLVVSPLISLMNDQVKKLEEEQQRLSGKVEELMATWEQVETELASLTEMAG